MSKSYHMSTEEGADAVGGIVDDSLRKRSRRHAREWAFAQMVRLAERFEEARSRPVRDAVALEIKRRFKPKLKRDWVGLAVRLNKRIVNGYGSMPAGTVAHVTQNKAGLDLEVNECACCGFRWSVGKVSEYDVTRLGAWEDYDKPVGDSTRPTSVYVTTKRDSEKPSGLGFSTSRGGAYCKGEIRLGDCSPDGLLALFESRQYLHEVNVEATVYVLPELAAPEWGIERPVAFRGRFIETPPSSHFADPRMVELVLASDGRSVPYAGAGISIEGNDDVIAAVRLPGSEHLELINPKEVTPALLAMACFDVELGQKLTVRLRELVEIPQRFGDE